MTGHRSLMHAACLSAAFCAGSAEAEVILACTFPTLPAAVMRFPDGLDAPKTMEVGGRPAVELIEGQGEGRFITATVDGYRFRFAPASLVLDVESDDATIASETGRCATIGGPVTTSALKIAGDPDSAVDTPTASEDVPEQDLGKWVVTEDKSAFDDTRTVVLTLDSNDTVRGQFGPAGPAKLYARCMENKTVFYLWINDLFLSDIQGFGVIDYRIDDRAASKLDAEGSTDNKALGLWSGGAAIPFLKDLASGTKVAFRATPFNESPVEFTFDLTGMEAAIVPLREACSW